jgi:hypothetical protein
MGPLRSKSSSPAFPSGPLSPDSRKVRIRLSLGGEGTGAVLSFRPSITRACSRTCLFMGVKSCPSITLKVPYLQLQAYHIPIFGFGGPAAAFVVRSRPPKEWSRRFCKIA